MQLFSNFYELYCYISNFIHNDQFLANFEMSELAFFNEHVHLNFWLIVSSKIERQWLSLKFNLNITRYQKNDVAIFLHAISDIYKVSNERCSIKIF